MCVLAQCNGSHAALVIYRNHLRQVADDMAAFQTNPANLQGGAVLQWEAETSFGLSTRAPVYIFFMMQYGSVNQKEVLTTRQWQHMNWLL